MAKILIVSIFNAGLQVFRHPRSLQPETGRAYFIQGANNTTRGNYAGRIQGNTNYCRKATFSDLGELDDRGYIYNMDRAGSGLTILKLTGDALDAVSAPRVGPPAATPPARMPEPLKEE